MCTFLVIAFSREKLSDLLQWSDHFMVQRILARIQDVPFYSEQAILYSKVLFKLVLVQFYFYFIYNIRYFSLMVKKLRLPSGFDAANLQK